MKRWALVTVLLYAAVLAALIAPVYWVAFAPKPPLTSVAYVFWLIPLWVWLGLMVLCQAALLVVPVRQMDELPARRIHVFWTILAAGVMFVVLAVGMGFVVWETVLNAWGSSCWTDNGWPAPWSLIAGVAAFWITWGIAFGFYTARAQPQGMMRRIVRWLIAGSILELLVAVPAHIYARAKDDCCGGIWTVWGLAAGIAVMLFAFGPGVFFLFVRRVRSIRGNRGKPQVRTPS